MRPYDKDSWKKKIDPAFDKPVKTYLKVLRKLERLPDDGQKIFNDEYSELIKKSIQLPVDYKTGFKSEMLLFNRDFGLISKHLSEVFIGMIYSLEAYNRLLRELIKKNQCVQSLAFLCYPKSSRRCIP